MLRAALDGRRLRIEAATGSLCFDEEPVPLDAPGAALFCEQLLLHEIGVAVIPADFTDDDLLRFAAVLGGFPGTYPTYADVLAALGPAGERIELSRASAGFEVFGMDAARPHALIEPNGEASRLRLHSTELDPAAAGAIDSTDAPTGGVQPESRAGISQFLVQCRGAVDRQDWEALLDAAVQIIEIWRTTTPPDWRGPPPIEFKRLMTRRNLAMIALWPTGTGSRRRLPCSSGSEPRRRKS